MACSRLFRLNRCLAADSYDEEYESRRPILARAIRELYYAFARDGAEKTRMRKDLPQIINESGDPDIICMDVPM